MDSSQASLESIFEGWDGYNTSLIHAVAPLTAVQLGWRPAQHLRTTGELVRHISLGRLTWFARMDAPGSAELALQVGAWETDSDGNQHPQEESLSIATNAGELVRWLETTWKMVSGAIRNWTVADLFQAYRHTWNGDAYSITRQWTVFRILAHDIHHGGELSLLLGLQGIQSFELSDLGGHIILPQLLE